MDFKPMSSDQEAHLFRITSKAVALINTKYRKGQAEHGGDLFAKSGIIDMAIDEAVDMVVYLLTLKEQLEHPERVRPELRDKA